MPVKKSVGAHVAMMLCLVVAIVTVPSRKPAAAQSAQGTVSRIAYESCYFDN